MATKPVKKPAPKRPVGRASLYTREIADEIIRRISDGEPLRQICRDEHIPEWRTIYDWMDRDKEFAAHIARAREKGEEAIAQEGLAIIDEPPERDAVTGKIDPGYVSWQKLRAEHRLKLLAKWNPKKWGDKVDLNHGGQPDNPLSLLVERLGGNVLGKAGD